MKDNNIDVLIIGGGPAGLTAAIYSARAGKRTLIIEKGAPGGKLNNTHQIDNYPGMEGKHGYELSMSFFTQAQKFGAQLKGGDVVEISNLDSKDEKKIKLSNGEEYTAKTIIIATGLRPKKLEVDGYDKYFGKGVGVCVVCDGAFYRNKNVAVIGGGVSATEESLFASEMIGKIYIINKFPSFIGEKITLDKLGKKNNVISMHNTEVKSINGNDDKVHSITIIKENGEEEILEVEGVFTYVGWDQENYFINDKKIIDENGFVIADDKTNSTIYPGVFAAGDIVNKPLRQVTIAASEGTKAGLGAVDYINKL